MNETIKTPREQAQYDIVKFLYTNSTKFNAPYGIIPDLQKLKRGAVRTITFGVSRYLDATIFIWAPNKIVVTGQGPLEYKYAGTYASVEELIAKFS